MEIIKGAKIESVIGKLEDSKNKNKKSKISCGRMKMRQQKIQKMK